MNAVKLFGNLATRAVKAHIANSIANPLNPLISNRAHLAPLYPAMPRP